MVRSGVIFLSLFTEKAAGSVTYDECTSLEDKRFCEDVCIQKFAQCLDECNTDVDCRGNCNREYPQCEADCPCHENCPNGTPCDVSFIVLNSFYTATPAATLFTWQLGGDRNEVTRELADFYGEGAGASDTCSMIYKGQMYILGGWPDRRQVSVLDGCKLIRMDYDLPEDMYDSPMCTSYNEGNDAMVGDGIEFWQFFDTGFVKVEDPGTYHDTGGMTHWNNQPILIGGSDVWTETFDGTKWIREEDLPAWNDPESTYIMYPSAVHFEGDAYVFGGTPEWYHEGSAHRFDGRWHNLQPLSGFRFGHRSVVQGDSIYHIGGYRNQTDYAPFEQWTYNRDNDNFTVTVSNTELFEFFTYPETFVVDAADYADCK